MIGNKETAAGDLHLTYRTNRPGLYDPKLVDLSANRMRFVGGKESATLGTFRTWICEL